jgi:hypothetical protein
MTDRQNRKNLYNIVHRLRQRGVGVDTINYAIETTESALGKLDRTSRRYLTTLQNEFGYAVQLCIQEPGTDHRSPAVLQPALKFRRRRK